jgi:hypothetical protein
MSKAELAMRAAALGRPVDPKSESLTRIGAKRDGTRVTPMKRSWNVLLDHPQRPPDLKRLYVRCPVASHGETTIELEHVMTRLRDGHVGKPAKMRVFRSANQ